MSQPSVRAEIEAIEAKKIEPGRLAAAARRRQWASCSKPCGATKPKP